MPPPTQINYFAVSHFVENVALGLVEFVLMTLHRLRQSQNKR